MLELAARARNIDEARACIELGFGILEITLPCPGGPAEEDFWLEMSGRAGITFLGHGPEEGNPRDLAGLESRYFPSLLQALEAASRLGCLGLTIHCWLDSRWLDSGVISAKIRLLKSLHLEAEAFKVKINLENLSENAEDLDRVLQAVPGIGLTLDLGHAQLTRPETTAREIINKHFSRLRHLHLHDNHGGPGPRDDLHLPPGQGIVPFSELFALLKAKRYSGTATLELTPEQMSGSRQWIQQAWEGA